MSTPGFQEPARTQRSPGPSWRWVPWLALPYAMAVTLWLANQPCLPGLVHDDGVYLSIAQSLRAGLGPVEGLLPASLHSASRYPVLYPALVAGAGQVLGVSSHGVDGANRLVLLNGPLLGLALFFLLRGVVGGTGRFKVARVVAVLSAFLSPALLTLALYLLSESLFLALLALALGFMARVDRRPGPRTWIAAAIVAGALPAVRTVGVAFVVAAAIHALLRHGWRRGGAFLGVMLATTLAFWMWSRSPGPLDPALRDVSLLGRPYVELYLGDPGQIPRVLGINLLRYTHLVVGVLVPGWSVPASTAGFVAQAIVALVLAALVTLGLIAGCRNGRRDPGKSANGLPLMASLGVALFVGMVLVYPYTDPRLLAPVLPLLFLAMVHGVERVVAGVCGLTSRQNPGPRSVDRAPASESRTAAPCTSASQRWFTGVVTAALLLSAGANLWASTRTFEWRPGELRFRGRPVDVAALSAAGDWLRHHTAPRTVFASTQNALLHQLSDRPGVWGWASGTPFEKYQGVGGDWRAFFRSGPGEERYRRLYARAPDVLDDFRRLDVEFVVLVGAVGHPVFEDVLAQTVLRSPFARHFEPVFQAGEVRVFRFS